MATPKKEKQYIWMDGKMVDKEKAVVPLMTHALHYGTGVFEGIRVYQTPKGRAVFRLKDHMVRFQNSAKALDMKLPYSVDEMCEAVRETVRVNPDRMDYIRPLAYYGSSKVPDKIVLNPSAFELNVAVALAYMGAYLGKENLEKGAKIITSSWKKPTNESTTLQAKICGNYVNSVICKIESNQLGADEALMLNSNGTVAEGPGENVFVIRNGKIITPSLASGVLEGITKDSVVTIAKDLGYEVIEREITRGEIWIADEFFMTGTAAEVTPCGSLDGRAIGNGKRGPITAHIQETFFEAARGKLKKYNSWLDYVDKK
ncbi:MAG: branched-chain amino acid aminotransferase [Methanomassiliicoccales archaeon PtaU1.Bin124]|nr:MAG: branched-chain amino acid aminotransferase [Methanomassiliicoccales archaeon PtaU1.Bin124]